MPFGIQFIFYINKHYINKKNGIQYTVFQFFLTTSTPFTGMETYRKQLHFPQNTSIHSLAPQSHTPQHIGKQGTGVLTYFAGDRVAICFGKSQSTLCNIFVSCSKRENIRLKISNMFDKALAIPERIQRMG